MKNFLLAAAVLLVACSDSHRPVAADSVPYDSLDMPAVLPPGSTVLDTIPAQSVRLSRMSNEQLAAAISNNTPEGWVVLDTMTGDLNRDAYTDLLLILRSTAEDTGYYEHPRPLLILTGNAAGELTLAERSEHAVLCKQCGGAWGDPYDGLAIKNGYFSVEHYGGSNWRWTRIITFRYNEKEKTWLLHRDAGVSFTVFEDGEEEEVVHNAENFGKVKFSQYHYE
jgi:hypothetical protein